jgi:lipid-binding SYLF domain-containing protein
LPGASVGVCRQQTEFRDALLYEATSTQILMRKTQCVLFLTITAAFSAAATDDTAARIGKAVAVLNTMTESAHGIRPEHIASADCIAVIPGFRKGAVVVGVGYGRGFISCRNGSGWSAPGAVTLESGSLGVQFGGETIDIVILSLDNTRRSKLLSDRFTIGSDASAAWGNGKSAHEDPNTKILFYGQTKGAFAGFGLDGATLKPDQSSNKALYGRTSSNSEIVEGGVNPPAVAQQFVARLTRDSSR